MIIIAKFNSKCAESGKVISKGTSCFWDKGNKKVYSLQSKEYEEYQARIASEDHDQRVYDSSYSMGKY